MSRDSQDISYAHRMLLVGDLLRQDSPSSKHITKHGVGKHAGTGKIEHVQDHVKSLAEPVLLCALGFHVIQDSAKDVQEDRVVRSSGDRPLQQT